MRNFLAQCLNKRSTGRKKYFCSGQQSMVFKFEKLFYICFSQEEEFRKSGEAKYAHLSNDLHVLIEVFAPPGEAYSRMSHALEEIKKFLVPVSLSSPTRLI